MYVYIQYAHTHTSIRVHTHWVISVTALSVAECESIVRHIHIRV